MTDEQYRANLEALASRLGDKALRDPTVHALAKVFSATENKTIEDCLVAMVQCLVDDKYKLIQKAVERTAFTVTRAVTQR